MGIYKNRQAVSTIEYMMLVMIVLAALLWMQQYVQRSYQGHWKQTGDSFASGRQYQASHVTDCAYAQINSDFGVWYDDTCYQYWAAAICRPADHDCENAIKVSSPWENNGHGCRHDYCCEEPNCNQ